METSWQQFLSFHIFDHLGKSVYARFSENTNSSLNLELSIRLVWLKNVLCHQTFLSKARLLPFWMKLITCLEKIIILSESYWHLTIGHVFTCSKWQMKTPEQYVNLFNSNVLISLLLILYKFHELLWCFHFWLWTSRCRLLGTQFNWIQLRLVYFEIKQKYHDNFLLANSPEPT